MPCRVLPCAGKFVLLVEETADLDRQLAVRVELAPDVQPSEALRAQVGAGQAGACSRVLGRWPALG